MNSLLKSITIVCLLSVIGIHVTNAETPEARQPKYIVSTKPLLLFDGEYKLSLEMPLISQKQWVGVGLSGFYLPKKSYDVWATRNTIDFDHKLKSLKGLGIDLTYKYYFLTTIMYVGGDVFYGHYRTKYDDYIFRQYEEDGLIFYERDYGQIRQNFNKVAGNVYIGIGTPLRNKFFIDTYIGAGYSHSFYNQDKLHFDSIFGYGYKGLYPVMGARIGLRF